MFLPSIILVKSQQIKSVESQCVCLGIGLNAATALTKYICPTKHSVPGLVSLRVPKAHVICARAMVPFVHVVWLRCVQQHTLLHLHRKVTQFIVYKRCYICNCICLTVLLVCVC